MMGRRERRNQQIKKVAIGSGIAAAAGFVAGVLTAPQSGKQTRKDIKQKAEKGRAEAEKELAKLHKDLTATLKDSKTSTKKLTKKAQSELDELIETAKDTKEKAHELLSTVKEGAASDKDIKKAVKDANSAIERLRDFLKK